ncbi:MAG: TIGR01620 family protein [Bauldia sp.]|nr:TIGR01620 family protein [Bauldia sp.]
MTGEDRRRPTAFDLSRVRLADEADEAAPEVSAIPVVVEEADPFADTAALPAPVPPRHRKHRWSRLFFAGVGGLVALALGLAVDDLVRALFDRTGWLGWLGVALTAIAVLALLVLAAREVVGLFRLRRIADIQKKATEAVETDDRATAREACRELVDLYGGRPEMARGRRALSGHLREIIDGRDLIGLAETELLASLDDAARRLVMNSAKRVSVVTAISPRALVDVLFVLTEILRLIRRLSTLYGGRPGVFGFISLTRRALGHLAITGGMAAGESMIQQILGHGIAARISARLGEGVINGILTARVGLAAIDVCRPLPFVEAKPPRLADIVRELTRREDRPAGAEDGAEPG